jgi:DNA-binding transcriptional ArsR family regulator
MSDARLRQASEISGPALTYITMWLYVIAMPQPRDILFRTLADPTRRAIFERLCRGGDQTVGALTAQAGVSQPAVSKHLALLKKAGLVQGRPDGRQTHYSAQLSALAPLIDWTSQMTGFWQSRFDQLEDLIKRMDQ